MMPYRPSVPLLRVLRLGCASLAPFLSASLVLALVLAGPANAAAQPTENQLIQNELAQNELAQSETGASAPGPVDPVRLAAARPVVEKLWPRGTYRRMMDGVMSGMMQQVMNQMFDMPARDFATAGGASTESTDAIGDKTMGELISQADPHFRERTTIATDVMLKEMIPLIEKLEPAIRDALAVVYARKFSSAQLADLNGFFATPSGQAFAGEFMMTFVDPELTGQMQAFVPELIATMPAIMTKVAAATAHLPPPPGQSSAPAEGDMVSDPAVFE